MGKERGKIEERSICILQNIPLCSQETLVDCYCLPLLWWALGPLARNRGATWNPHSSSITSSVYEGDLLEPVDNLYRRIQTANLAYMLPIGAANYVASTT